MATLLEMPRYGATMEEGLLGEWLVREGDPVTEGMPLCSIEIEKLTNEMPAPTSGILRRILLAAGDSAPCGAPIGIIAAADEDISALVPGAASGAAPESIAASAATTTPGTPAEPVPGQGTVPISTPAAPVALGPRPITPKAARLAAELGVDYTGLKGSGRLGMVTRDDVRAAAGTAPRVAAQVPVSIQAPANAQAPTAAQAKPGLSPANPVLAAGAMPSGARRVIAQRMMESTSQTAQASIWMDADVTELMEAYRQARTAIQQQGVRLSVTALVIKALAEVLPAHPVCRSRITSDGRLTVMQDIHIAVAVDAPSGLLVPVLRDADRKDLGQVALELTELSERARIGALGPDEMSGHTMTISNLGMYGVTYLRPVLNLPESVILGVGATQLRPVYINGGLFPREIMPLSLSFDHRIVDGGPAAAFLRDVARALGPQLVKPSGPKLVDSTGSNAKAARTIEGAGR